MLVSTQNCLLVLTLEAMEDKSSSSFGFVTKFIKGFCFVYCWVFLTMIVSMPFIAIYSIGDIENVINAEDDHVHYRCTSVIVFTSKGSSASYQDHENGYIGRRSQIDPSYSPTYWYSFDVLICIAQFLLCLMAIIGIGCILYKLCYNKAALNGAKQYFIYAGLSIASLIFFLISAFMSTHHSDRECKQQLIDYYSWNENDIKSNPGTLLYYCWVITPISFIICLPAFIMMIYFARTNYLMRKNMTRLDDMHTVNEPQIIEDEQEMIKSAATTQSYS